MRLLINHRYAHLEEFVCGLHHDLNISNILYREVWPGEYDFQLIDINRMDFKRRRMRSVLKKR